MLDKILGSKSASMFIALSILTHAKELKGLLPEMLYIFESDKLLEFFKVFEGKTIKVPKYNELRLALLTSAFFYKTKIDGISEDHCKYLLELKMDDFRKVKSLCDDWYASLSEEDRTAFLNSKGIKDFTK